MNAVSRPAGNILARSMGFSLTLLFTLVANLLPQDKLAGQQSIEQVRQSIVDPDVVIINLATIYIAFSRCVRLRGKASKCRCSGSTASFDNAARASAAQRPIPYQ